MSSLAMILAGYYLRMLRSQLQPRPAIASSLQRIKAHTRYWKDLKKYRAYTAHSELPEEIKLDPCLEDWSTSTPIEPTYFYQDAWAFEHIVRSKPLRHVDVGSHHKYVALLSKVVELTMVDIRPLSLPMASIHFSRGSILELPFQDMSLHSLSSLCVIEHIGLGRYGDPLDRNGSRKAGHELARVMAPGGDLYVSVPVEKMPKTYFNAHRSFSEESFLSQFANFAVLDKKYIYGTSFCDKIQNAFGIGCYWLRRSRQSRSPYDEP